MRILRGEGSRYLMSNFLNVSTIVTFFDENDLFYKYVLMASQVPGSDCFSVCRAQGLEHMAFGAGRASSPHIARFLGRGPPIPSHPISHDLCLAMRSSSCRSSNCWSDCRGSSSIYEAPQDIKVPAELNFFPSPTIALRVT